MPQQFKEQLLFTDLQVETFNREGFIAIDQLTDPEEVSKIRDIFDRLFNDQTGRSEGDRFDLAGTGDSDNDNPASLPQIMHPAKYAPELNDTLLLKNASKALSLLFGEAVQASFFHSILKPPRHGSETPGHQDAAYWDPAKKHRKISVWVPLQKVVVENGCMQFIPESHTMDVLPHQNINKDPRVHGLELVPEERDKIKDRAVPCPLPPGGATFHGGYTLHYAGTNQTDSPRRAIILEGELPAVDRDEPLNFPWLNRSDDDKKK